jgi:MYXO-CTERM domain-containing protein
VTLRSATILLALLTGFLFGLGVNAPANVPASWGVILGGVGLVAIAMLEARAQRR